MAVVDAASPCGALDAVRFLLLKILLEVVDDKRALKGTPESTKVFDKSSIMLVCVLSVEPVLDELIVRVQLIQNEVRVALVGRREDHDLVDQAQLL